jgi:hypothetical protein
MHNATKKTLDILNHYEVNGKGERGREGGGRNMEESEK